MNKQEIIYVCLQCGEFIRYSMTPCLYCGYYPDSLEEVAKYDLLNNRVQTLDLLIPLARLIKHNDTYEDKLPNWDGTLKKRVELIKNDGKFAPIFEHYDEDFIAARADRAYVRCANCRITQFIAAGENVDCISCKRPNGMSTKQCWVVALQGLLRFVTECEVVVRGEDKSPTEEAICLAVKMLNGLIETFEMPSAEDIEELRDLLWQVQIIGINDSELSLSITPHERVTVYTGETQQDNRLEQELVVLSVNLTYILAP